MPASTNARPRQSRRSRQELLALRKEIVLTKIAVERAELAQSTQRLRENLHGFRWLRLLVPGLSRPQSLLKVTGLLERYPYLSAIASLALTGLSRTPAGRLARPLLKWSGIGVLAWQGYRFWRDATRSDDPQTSARESWRDRRKRRAQEAAEAQTASSSATENTVTGCASQTEAAQPSV